jgi:hypothetical protein
MHTYLTYTKDAVACQDTDALPTEQNVIDALDEKSDSDPGMGSNEHSHSKELHESNSSATPTPRNATGAETVSPSGSSGRLGRSGRRRKRIADFLNYFLPKIRVGREYATGAELSAVGNEVLQRTLARIHAKLDRTTPRPPSTVRSTCPKPPTLQTQSIRERTKRASVSAPVDASTLSQFSLHSLLSQHRSCVNELRHSSDNLESGYRCFALRYVRTPRSTSSAEDIELEKAVKQRPTFRVIQSHLEQLNSNSRTTTM